MTDLPQRKPNRLNDYDYSQNGAYFVTICAKERKNLFSKIIGNQIQLTQIGEIINEEIKTIHKIRHECIIDKFVIMPNHLHLIVRIVGDDGNRPDETKTGGLPSAPTVSNMVQGLKGAVSRQIGFSPWQRSFYDHIIRNEQDYNRIAEYIENNPTKWTDDCFNRPENMEIAQ